MEVKVSVEGVQRVVCGVTDKTTCQEVVIALARALGRTGRYTLKEKFKEFERNMSPDERLLESLGKYGQQSREVQLTLLHNGPSLRGGWWDRPRGGTQQTSTLLRKVDAGSKRRKGNSSCSLHRQSLPPLSRLCLNVESLQIAEAKKPKRKSLTLVEEAFGWLENLSRTGKPQRGQDRERNKEAEKRKDWTSDSSHTTSGDHWSSGSVHGTISHRKTAVTVHQKQTRLLEDSLSSSKVCVMDKNGVNNDNREREANKNRDVNRDHELNTAKANTDGKPDPHPARNTSFSPPPTSITEEKLRALLIHQRTHMHDLQLKLDSTDTQIQELEERQTVWLKQEALAQLTEDEGEELDHWENELKAEEGYEKDLQEEFLEMKEKAAECKAKLEEYKRRLQGLDLDTGKKTLIEAEVPVDPEQGSSRKAPKSSAPSWTKPHTSTFCAAAPQDGVLQQTNAFTLKKAEGERRLTPISANHHPHVQVSPHRIADSQVRGTGQLREWWALRSDAQTQSGTRPTPVVHRSEMTIQLSSTRV